MHLRDSYLESADFTGADQSGSDLYTSVLAPSNFTNADLRLATMTGTNPTAAIFDHSNLSGVSLSGATIGSANFTNANLSRATFSDASDSYGENPNVAPNTSMSRTPTSRTPICPGWISAL